MLKMLQQAIASGIRAPYVLFDSCGELFYEVCDELPDITWEEAFRILMKQLAAATTEKLFLTEDDLERLLEDFLLTLPKALNFKAQKCA
jgi:hypothetical protein